jgi:hypothetical protein
VVLLPANLVHVRFDLQNALHQALVLVQHAARRLGARAGVRVLVLSQVHVLWAPLGIDYHAGRLVSSFDFTCEHGAHLVNPEQAMEHALVLLLPEVVPLWTRCCE